MKTLFITATLSISVMIHPLRAEFLFDSYLVPGFDGNPNTEYSQWDVLHSPNAGANFPDIAAPNGMKQSASAAGFAPPSDASPANPLAFWHLSNPTLSQTNGGHFIIGPGTVGNIYSPSVLGAYRVADATPYTLGTVVFQFMSEGTSVSFPSIKLRYHDGSGIQELSPTENIREHRAASSAFGGTTNRNALQWDVTGLGISNYEIVFNSQGSSMSFQQALLDTAATYESVVPAARTWIGTGAQGWTTPSQWREGSTSIENGNVAFQNTAPSAITLDGNRKVGQVTFDTASDVSISGASKLTVNTGISTALAANATYSIRANYELGAFNVMDINAGEVRLTGAVTGDYGLLKTGAGKLVLANNTTFGTPTAGVGVQGGTLRLAGTNTYGGISAVLYGTLEVAGNAPSGLSGALGSATSTVIVGASSSTFAGITEAAVLVIDGNHTIARNINVEQGTFEKRLGAKNATGEAVFSGNIALLGAAASATSVKLFAESATDRVRFTGGITGGTTTSTLAINANGELGSVIFSGANKTYSHSTTVAAGTLEIASGTATTGNGAWSVGTNAALKVNGTLGGTGTLTLASGSSLTGSGTINKAVTIGTGVKISPGNSLGTLTTGAQTWASGGTYQWEINDVDAGSGSNLGWDLANVAGSLTLTATQVNPFTIEVTSLTLGNTAGAVHDFNDLTSYSWTLASATGGIVGFSAEKFAFDTTAFAHAFTGAFGITQAGNDLLLTYTAVPEPSVWMLIALPAALLLLRTRRPARSALT